MAKLRRFQFSLYALFIATACVAVFCGLLRIVGVTTTLAWFFPMLVLLAFRSLFVLVGRPLAWITYCAVLAASLSFHLALLLGFDSGEILLWPARVSCEYFGIIHSSSSASVDSFGEALGSTLKDWLLLLLVGSISNSTILAAFAGCAVYVLGWLRAQSGEEE